MNIVLNWAKGSESDVVSNWYHRNAKIKDPWSLSKFAFGLSLSVCLRAEYHDTFDVLLKLQHLLLSFRILKPLIFFSHLIEIWRRLQRVTLPRLQNGKGDESGTFISETSINHYLYNALRICSSSLQGPYISHFLNILCLFYL